MLKAVIICILLSMTPVAELRAAMPVGVAMGLPPILLYIVCVAANLLPVPFIILFVRRVLSWMSSKGGKLAKAAEWVDSHAQKKLRIYYKYELLGLFVLVAIPLPGTGAWTGALVAAILGLRLKHSMPAIALGVAVAGILVMLLSLGIFGAV